MNKSDKNKTINLSPPKLIPNRAATKTTNHSSDSKDRDSNGPDQILLAILYVPVVSRLPAVTDEVLDDWLRRIDDSSVVAKLEHPKHGREDGVA